MNQIAAFNQRFIFPLPFAMKLIKINLWNQGNPKGGKGDSYLMGPTPAHYEAHIN